MYRRQDGDLYGVKPFDSVFLNKHNCQIHVRKRMYKYKAKHNTGDFVSTPSGRDLPALWPASHMPAWVDIVRQHGTTPGLAGGLQSAYTALSSYVFTSTPVPATGPAPTSAPSNAGPAPVGPVASTNVVTAPAPAPAPATQPVLSLRDQWLQLQSTTTVKGNSIVLANFAYKTATELAIKAILLGPRKAKPGLQYNTLELHPFAGLDSDSVSCT
jgi:hypothetical protein